MPSSDTPDALVLPPIYRELSDEIQRKLNLIVGSSSFAEQATLESAFTEVQWLAQVILDAPNAVAQWHADDLEERLAASNRVVNRLATLEGPPPNRADRVPDPPIFEGGHENLEGFVAQLHVKLFSDPSRFPNLLCIWDMLSTGWGDVHRHRFFRLSRTGSFSCKIPMMLYESWRTPLGTQTQLPKRAVNSTA